MLQQNVHHRKYVYLAHQFLNKPEWISWGYLVMNNYIQFLINLSDDFNHIFVVLHIVAWQWPRVSEYCGWVFGSDSDGMLWLSG